MTPNPSGTEALKPKTLDEAFVEPLAGAVNNPLLNPIKKRPNYMKPKAVSSPGTVINRLGTFKATLRKAL